jgi:probable rRNA maturation factor
MLKIIIQRATRTSAPTAAALRRWAQQTLRDKEIFSAEIIVRIVNSKEMTELNSTYRHKQGATNVLSFPYDYAPEDELPHLGDIVICAEVVNREAKERHQLNEAHWAHMVVHGVLHILGHDHVQDADADVMEALEISTLKNLGYDNPYQL